MQLVNEHELYISVHLNVFKNIPKGPWKDKLYRFPHKDLLIMTINGVKFQLH